MTYYKSQPYLTPEVIQKYKDRDQKWLLSKAETVFNKWIRKRDQLTANTFKCISCGQIKPIQGRNYHAGHFYNTHEYGALRFAERNCHGQCLQCNHFKSADLLLYRENLIKKIGRKAFEELVFDAARSRRKKKAWHRMALIEIIEKYKL